MTQPNKFEDLDGRFPSLETGDGVHYIYKGAKCTTGSQLGSGRHLGLQIFKMHIQICNLANRIT